MDQFLLTAIQTNSPAVIICALMILALYYFIKSQREKTAKTRDEVQKHNDVKMALQDKEIEFLKSQVNILITRWDDIQELLSKINENLSAIREKMGSLDDRIDRLEDRTEKQLFSK